MHAQHPHIAFIPLVVPALAHERTGNGRVNFFGKAPGFVGSTGGNDSAAAVKKWPFTFLKQGGSPQKALFIRKRRLFGRNRAARGKFRFLRRYVFGDIHQHRPFAPGTGDPERAAQGIRQIFHIPDKVIVLGNRHGDPSDIHLLKAVQPQKPAGDVPGDGHHGDRIHVGGGDTGNQVGRARAGRGNADPYLSRGPGIPIGRMRRRLLVAGADVADTVTVLVQRVVQVQHGAARIPENRIHPLLQQTLHNNLCSGQKHSDSSFLDVSPAEGIKKSAPILR